MTHFSHLYLFCPLSLSLRTRFSSASLRLEARPPARSSDTSRIESNVSLLCPHARQCTLERNRPPKSWCTNVVSLTFWSSLLCEWVWGVNRGTGEGGGER